MNTWLTASYRYMEYLLSISVFRQAFASLNIVILIAFVVTMLLGALLFFVSDSKDATNKIISVIEDNHTVTRKMQLYGQLMEYARGRTRLSSVIILEDDIFIQDEINMQLEIFANQYSRARLELLALPLTDEELAIIDSQRHLVSKILPAQREAVVLAMRGDEASRQQARVLLETITYPGQGKLIDGFLQLMEMETNTQEASVERIRAENVASARKMEWITNLVLLSGIAISILVIYRVYLNQREVNNSRKELETKVKEKTVHLQRSEERLNRSQEIAQVGTWDWDIKENNIYWSDETFRMFGLVPQQYAPTYENFKSFIHKDDIELLDRAVQSALDDPDTRYHIDHRIIRVNGEERMVEEMGEVMRNENGVPVRMIGVVHDITERMQAERLKSEFVSIISHELRTPLTAIQGSVKLLLGNVVGKLDEGMRGMLSLANNNCDRLLHLVNDILDLQKIESGKMKYQFIDIDVQDMMNEVKNVVEPYAISHDIKLVKKQVDESVIHGDKMRLLQVMNNLISNAVKFSDTGKEVEISAVLEDGIVVFSVKDYGRGIPKAFHDKLFKRFSQVDSSDKREQLGTGLGLAITLSIVEEHQGHIWFESEPNQGTTFHFSLDAVT